MNQNEKDFILKYYSEINNEECGPWNTSLKSKWYEYEITKYFEDNFPITSSNSICNIGIGPGHWDRYLSYKMKKDAKLVSIDIDNEITETFRLCLENEQNKRNIEIVNMDIFDYKPNNKFDIITMIGSAVPEIGHYDIIFNKALSMLSDDGALFYSTIDKSESRENIEKVLENTQFKLNKYLKLENYGGTLILTEIIKWRDK